MILNKTIVIQVGFFPLWPSSQIFPLSPTPLLQYHLTANYHHLWPRGLPPLWSFSVGSNLPITLFPGLQPWTFSVAIIPMAGKPSEFSLFSGSRSTTSRPDSSLSTPGHTHSLPSWFPPATKLAALASRFPGSSAPHPFGLLLGISGDGPFLREGLSG